jgi:hypothetical protein
MAMKTVKSTIVPWPELEQGEAGLRAPFAGVYAQLSF